MLATASKDAWTYVRTCVCCLVALRTRLLLRVSALPPPPFHALHVHVSTRLRFIWDLALFVLLLSCCPLSFQLRNAVAQPPLRRHIYLRFVRLNLSPKHPKRPPPKAATPYSFWHQLT